MRIVETIEGDGIRLPRLHLRDGRAVLYGGMELREQWHQGPVDQLAPWPRGEVAEVARATGFDIVAVAFGPNVVFDAALRSEGGLFRDADTGSLYRANDGAAIRILEAAVAGRLAIADGVIHGRFTFRKHSRVRTLCLHTEQPRPLDTPVNAEDLSDFIKTLGKA